MKKALGRQAAIKRMAPGDAAANKHAGKHPVRESLNRRVFDPDALLNSMDGMVFVASPDYRIEYMNETAIRKLGRDMTGLPCYTALHGLDDRCPWCMAGLVLQGRTVRQEVQSQRNGRWYSCDLTPLQREDGTTSIQSLVFDITDQKQVEKALIQSEALLQSILQAAPAGIGMVRDRVIEWTSGHISQITGYSPEELKGKSARIFYPSDEEFDRVGRHKYAEMQRTGIGSIVTVWQCKDGRSIDIFLRSTPIDPGDLSAGVVFTALDITEKKRTRDELWRSEEKYRALFENAVMGIFQSTPGGRFLSVNPATAAMYGYDSPEEMVASITDIPAQHYVDPADRDLFVRTIEEQDFVKDFEHRTVRKDGSVFWVSVNARAVRNRRGDITHIEGTYEDITRRISTEEALRQSEERFSKAFRSNPAPLAISTIDEGRYIDVNDRFLEMFGYSRDEVIGRTSKELDFWTDLSERTRLIGELLDRGSVRNSLVTRKNKAGEIRYTLWSAETIELGDRDVLLTLHQDITDRKRAEEKLRWSEEKYRSLFENSLVGVFQSSLEGRYISVNPAFARMYGYASPEEVISSITSIGREVFVDEEDRRHCLAILNETGILERFEARTRRKDGSIIWTAINSRIVRDAQGQPLFIEGVIEDITERRRAEDVLKLNERRLEALQILNQMSRATVRELCDFALEEGVRLTGSEIGYLAFLSEDETVMNMYSWSRSAREQCAVRDLSNVFHVEKTGLWGEAIRQRRPVVANDYRAPSPLKKGVPDGHVPIIRHMNAPIFDGQRIVAVAGVGNKGSDYDESDILQLTLLIQGLWRIIQRRQSEEALRESEQRYRQLIESCPIGIAICDLEGRFLDANRSYIEMTGYDLDELKEKRYDEITPPEYHETERNAPRMMGRAKTLTYDKEYVKKDGTRFPVSLTAWYATNARGEKERLGAFATDLTDKAQQQKERQALESQLRQAQKMEAVGTLAGGIAHDFNNILFAVIGYTELCLQDETDEEIRWNLSQVLSACGRAKALVSQILAFSRQAEQERRPLDIVPLAKETAAFLRSSLPVTIDLSLEADATNSMIMADATQIHQVLMNLCTNAAHAMRTSGGRLGISIDHAPPPAGLFPEEAGVIGTEGFLHLSVSDTGQGIERHHINRIFDPFFTTKAPGEGSGLGLSVVYGIVKGLGGAIRVDSTPGRGSTFDIYLPAVAAQLQEPERPVGPIPRGSERILFVDDEEHLVDVMGQVLSTLGYRVTTARESRNALRMFRENPGDFDLVITDMTMPDMTGAELTREILRLRPDMPIILCTGYSELIGEEEALRMGIRRFLMKPLFVGDVAREIRAVIDGQERRSAV